MGGTICNLFSIHNFWDHELVVYSVLQGYIPSVSMTSISINYFPFLLSISFLLSNPKSSLYPSSFNSYCLFSSVLSPWIFFIYHLSSHWPVALFSIYRTICMSGNQLWKLHTQINPCCQSLLMPTSFWVLSLGCILTIKFLFWQRTCPVIPSTSCINSCLHVSSLIAADHCAMSAP